MPIAQADRISFSLYEVTAPAQIKGIQNAQASINAQIVSAQALDTANFNLFIPSNTLINQYTNEFQYIDGNVRTTIVEQDIINSANKIFQNHFFPNDTSTVVPDLSALHNIWPYLNPFALTYAVGKNYVEGYGALANFEDELITTIQGYTVLTDPLVVTATVNIYVTVATSERAAILAISDPNSTNTTNNTAAYNNINSVLLPALNLYLTGHSLSALQTAVTNRATFLTTRVSQLNAVLGSITQDLVTNGAIIASSGLYGLRYSFLPLRLNALNGSLTILASLQNASNAQTNIIENIQTTAATYFSILPTSAFQSNANGTQFISLVNVSFLSTGDSVYVMADNQVEMQLAIKTIVGNSITLSSPVPAKYTVSSNARLYKDLT